MARHYVLGGDGKTPVEEPDFIKAATWMDAHNVHVADTELPEGFRISTVFLGIDMSHGRGEPVLFETMVFGDYRQEASTEAFGTRRYRTWVEAEAGHIDTVDAVLNWIAQTKDWALSARPRAD